MLAATRRAPLLAPALLALGASACGGEDAQRSALTPVILDAEGGTIGASVVRVTDATDSSITYLTAGMNMTEAPADLTDPRVSSQAVGLPAPGEYEIYARVRIGPEGGNDDSFFVNLPSAGAPSWQNVNGIAGYDVQGSPRYQEGAIVGAFGGNSAPGVWRWALLDGLRWVAAAGELSQTFSFATREDGLDIDKFAFALVGDGYTVGFTTSQLDAGQAGVIVPTPVLPDPFEPPPDQPPLVVGSTKFLGMVCCGSQRPFLENYFNQIAPENGGKWGSVESVRDEYDWTALDEALALAEQNGFPFRYHVLLWGSQQPAWIATLPPEEQLAEIREWFEAVNARYGERLDFIEVANEFDNQPPTAANQGNYVEALGGAGESGFDWVLTAFRMAREIFPRSAKLMLNEYSVINTEARTELYLRLVQRLQQEDLIDAMGEQAHAFSTTGDVAPMVDRINRLGSSGLPLYLTEMDIDGPPAQQLIDIQRLFPAFWQNPNVHGITFWGYRDGMWRSDQQATLVYPNGAEKPALRWLKGYLRGTAPVVAGPSNPSLARGAQGTEVATFSVSGPDGAAYPAGAEISWGVVQGNQQGDGAVLQALAFAEGTGRLELVKPLQPGSYRARVYVDVDATVSNLYDLEIAVQ
ncbi:MAG: endo-1,4-beta-xylanase [Deltaproteobacteria bacterium]